jgi:hypothetical protein
VKNNNKLLNLKSIYGKKFSGCDEIQFGRSDVPSIFVGYLKIGLPESRR